MNLQRDDEKLENCTSLNTIHMHCYGQESSTSVLIFYNLQLVNERQR